MSPAPVYDEAPPVYDGVYGAVYGEDSSQVINTPVNTAYVPQLFTVFTPNDAPHPEAQGGANGHHNGTVSHEAAGVTDPVCPQCAKSACQPYGVNGRVCMQCAYCERPRPV